MLVLHAIRITGSALFQSLDGAEVRLIGPAVPMFILMCLAGMGLVCLAYLAGNGRRPI